MGPNPSFFLSPSHNFFYYRQRCIISLPNYIIMDPNLPIGLSCKSYILYIYILFTLSLWVSGVSCFDSYSNKVICYWSWTLVRIMELTMQYSTIFASSSWSAVIVIVVSYCFLHCMQEFSRVNLFVIPVKDRHLVCLSHLLSFLDLLESVNLQARWMKSQHMKHLVIFTFDQLQLLILQPLTFPWQPIRLKPYLFLGLTRYLLDNI